MSMEIAVLGRKDDGDKMQLNLVPWHQIMDVVQVLEHGATKYGAENWKSVTDARNRYFSAALRHVFAWYNGEPLDEESGLPHLAHSVCSLLFLMWRDDQDIDKIHAQNVRAAKEIEMKAPPCRSPSCSSPSAGRRFSGYCKPHAEDNGVKMPRKGPRRKKQ